MEKEQDLFSNYLSISPSIQLSAKVILSAVVFEYSLSLLLNEKHQQVLLAQGLACTTLESWKLYK